MLPPTFCTVIINASAIGSAPWAPCAPAPLTPCTPWAPCAPPVAPWAPVVPWAPWAPPPPPPPPVAEIVIVSKASSTTKSIPAPGIKSISLDPLPSLNLIVALPPVANCIAFKLYGAKVTLSHSEFAKSYANIWLGCTGVVRFTSDNWPNDNAPVTSTSTSPLYKWPFAELIHNVLSGIVLPLTSVHTGFVAEEGKTNPPFSILTQPTKYPAHVLLSAIKLVKIVSPSFTVWVSTTLE